MVRIKKKKILKERIIENGTRQCDVVVLSLEMEKRGLRAWPWVVPLESRGRPGIGWTEWDPWSAGWCLKDKKGPLLVFLAY